MLDKRFVLEPSRPSEYEVTYVCAVCGEEFKQMVSTHSKALSVDLIPEGMAHVEVYVKVSKTDYSQRDYAGGIQMPVCDRKPCLRKGPRKALTLLV